MKLHIVQNVLIYEALIFFSVFLITFSLSRSSENIQYLPCKYWITVI